MRFFLVMALVLPLMAEEFFDEIIEEIDENTNNRPYCGTPPSPPADTKDTKDATQIRGATRTVNPITLWLPRQQNKKPDPKEVERKSAR